MLAFFYVLVALAIASVHALSGDINSRDTDAMQLPQCANLTLSWTKGVAPYTTVITDETGLTESITSSRHKFTWGINFPAYSKVSFWVTDSTGTAIGAGGPYEVISSGDISCLCAGIAISLKRDDAPSEPRAEESARSLSIDLPEISERDAAKMATARGLSGRSSWSIKHNFHKRRHQSVCPTFSVGL